MRTGVDQLAAAFREGDLRAFKGLVERLTRRLIARAYRYTLDWEDARDLTQETWLTVYRQIHRYDTAKPFEAWLTVVHRNRCLSFLRRPVVTREIVDSSRIESLSAPDSSQDPLQDLEVREFEGRIRDALKHLTESQRRVFVLVDLEQGNQDEVAMALNMKQTTLRATLHFARRRMAQLLLETEETACATK